MQDPNEDTEWNDILRKQGILPPREEVVGEDDINYLVHQAAKEKEGLLEHGKAFEDMSLDDLDEIEDDEDERVLLEYRRKRMAEMQAMAGKRQFGEVMNITAQEYQAEINQAGKGVWVVLLLYQTSIMSARKLQQIFSRLAPKFPTTKFVQSVATNCIPNYPDKNVPTVFVYYEDEMKQQWIGAHHFGGLKMTEKSVEYVLGKCGAVKTDIEDDPRIEPMVDAMASTLAAQLAGSDSDD
eukprot:m.480814 g.480814  ORF g.480814 m.480814 type:complete len:239 (+) comp21959_c0_seq1:132-848(+)